MYKGLDCKNYYIKIDPTRLENVNFLLINFKNQNQIIVVEACWKGFYPAVNGE